MAGELLQVSFHRPPPRLRRRRYGRQVRVIMALAAAVLLSGCSQADEPAVTLPPLPSASPSPSRSPSPSPAASVPKPVLPELAKQRTSEGASAYATFYFDSVTWSFANAEPSAMRSAASPECESCESLAGLVVDLQNMDRRRKGGQYQVISALTPALSDDLTVVDLRYKRPGASTVDSSGAVVETFKAVPPTSVSMILEWRDNSWVVEEFKLGDEPS